MMEHWTTWVSDGESVKNLDLRFHDVSDNIYIVDPVLSVSIGASQEEYSINMDDLIELKCFLEAVINAYNLKNKNNPK